MHHADHHHHLVEPKRMSLIQVCVQHNRSHDCNNNTFFLALRIRRQMNLCSDMVQSCYLLNACCATTQHPHQLFELDPDALDFKSLLNNEGGESIGKHPTCFFCLFFILHLLRCSHDPSKSIHLSANLRSACYHCFKLFLQNFQPCHDSELQMLKRLSQPYFHQQCRTGRGVDRRIE
jgi:hypothetical protein